MELKTLRDLQNNVEGYTWHSVSAEELRQEVIKWIKSIQARITKGIAYNFEEMKRVWQGQINILMEVHNITEEELKDD